MSTENDNKAVSAAPASAATTAGAPRPRTGAPMGAPRPAGPGGYRGPARPGAGPGGFRGRPPMRRRVCRICAERIGGVDWKGVNFLRNFITERGKMLSARATGTCSRCQRQLTRAIKRARNLALLPTSPL